LKKYLTLLHTPNNIKIIRKLSGNTQVEFIALFTDVTESMQKSYEAGRATPSLLYLEELSEITAVSVKDLRNKELKKGDIKKIPPRVKLDEKGKIVEKVENVVKGEKSAASGHIELLAAEDLKFRGLLIAKFATIEANLKALNNKVAQINEKVTGESSTVTLAELEKTTQTVAKMLREELEKMLLKP
jgi:transcriptional regulator with XRE-family HTH domain